MRKLFSLFAALTLSVGLWAENSVITFTSTRKLYPGDINELEADVMMGDGAKWEAFKAQYPEFNNVMNPMDLEMMGIGFFNPNAFLDANGQVLDYTYNYDDATKTGTITFAGELVTVYGNDATWPLVYAFSRCTALTSITLPEGVTSIGKSAFADCTALTSVILPESLSSIGELGFLRCSSLSSVTIPANVTYLGSEALRDISSLTDVYVAWTTTLPTLQDNAIFIYSPIEDATLHVPAGSKALYQNADVWKGFGTFVEYITPAIAIAAVNAEIEETDNDNVKAIATSAATAINAATTEAEIYALKDLAIANIASAKAAYTAGEEAVRAALPTEGTTGPAITITKGDKTVTFYNTDKVEYSIVDAD